MPKWKLVFPATMAALTLFLANPQAGWAQQELVIQFRSTEDPDLEPDLSVCADAPFGVNLVTAAALLAPQVRGKDGSVVNLGEQTRGSGTACFGIPIDVILDGFPPWSQSQLYTELSIGGITVRADGVCTGTSNDVPTPGLVLAGCALTVTEAPEGFVGGSMGSNSVFNPFGVPGFFTGSFWTLRLFEE